MTLQELRFHFSPSSTSSACSSKWKQQNVLEWVLIEEDVSDQFWESIWQAQKLHTVGRRDCYSKEFVRGWFSTNVFKWPNEAYLSNGPLGGLHPSSTCAARARRVFGMTLRDSFRDTWEIWSVKFHLIFLPKHPLSGLFGRLFHKTWYKI